MADDLSIPEALRREIASMPPATVFGISAVTDLVERISKSDMAYFIARTALKQMAADGEFLDLGNGLFATLDNGKPPAAADVVRSYGERAGYRVFADDEAAVYRTGGPSIFFKIGDREIRIEHYRTLSKMTWKASILADFPDLFPYDIAFACEQGWETIIRQMCSRITSELSPDELADFRFLDIKEKWGGLRVSYIGSEKASAAVEEAEIASDHICEICGRPGENKQGLRTRCAVHEGIGSGSFLKDRGYPDPEATRAKFEIITEIELAIDERDLTVGQVEEFTDVPVPVLDARWTAGMLKKDIKELESIRNRIRELPLPER
jgi:hypothetical protein